MLFRIKLPASFNETFIVNKFKETLEMLREVGECVGN